MSDALSGSTNSNTTPVKHPAFRENPQRCVYLSGEIGQSTLDKLTPEIISLRLASDAPITLYIDSPGGSTYHARLLLGLLKAPTQDGNICPLVTVVTGTAASAAADLLSAGDYAVAYPHSNILFHGTRQRPPQVLTKEKAAMMAQSLKDTNEGFALELAQRAFSRFFFRYIMLKSRFDELRTNLHRPDMTDVECLAEQLKERVAVHADLPDVALQKHRRLTALEDYVTSRWKIGREFKTSADFEAFILRCIISYERKEKKNEPTWAFSDDSLVQMQEDFLVIRDYRVGKHTRNLKEQVEKWGAICLDQEEQKEYGTVDAADREKWLIEKTSERMRALGYFFVSMCRALQDGENFMSSEEAYWLGLIDEVAGRPDLPCMRMVMENPPKQSAATSIATEAKPAPSAAEEPKQVNVPQDGVTSAATTSKVM